MSEAESESQLQRILKDPEGGKEVVLGRTETESQVS